LRLIGRQPSPLGPLWVPLLRSRGIQAAMVTGAEGDSLRCAMNDMGYRTGSARDRDRSRNPLGADA
jgi:hypothetical protein